MTYEQFLDKIKENKIKINFPSYIEDINEKLFLPPYLKCYDKNWKNMKPRFDFILQSWSIGGVTGGSCWENSDPQGYTDTSDIPQSFDDLDKILEIICPSVSFLKYKKLESSLIIQDEATEYEYYGNRTDYVYRYVKLKELYDFLVKECNLFDTGH